MKRMYLLIRTVPVALAAMMMAPAAAAPPPPLWETVDNVVADTADDLAVTVRDRYIYVSVPRSTDVKLFTILGQPIARATLPAGTSRFKVSARGIYILKAGSITKRITI